MTATPQTPGEIARKALRDWHEGRHDVAIDAVEAASLTGDEAAMGLLVQLSGMPEAPADMAARTRKALEAAPSGVMRDRHRAYFQAAGHGATEPDWAGALSTRFDDSERGDWVALTELGLLAIMSGRTAAGHTWLEQAGKAGAGLAIAPLMR